MDGGGGGGGMTDTVAFSPLRFAEHCTNAHTGATSQKDKETDTLFDGMF